MARLIDADLYIDEYQTAIETARKIGGEEMRLLADFYCEVIKDIEKCKTVDAVPVVMCRECKYSLYAGLGKFSCDLHDLVHKGYFYCADGERKDNAEE